MRIYLDEKNYLDLKEDKFSGKVKMSIKIKDDEKKSFLVTTLLDLDQVDKIISTLVELKVKL